MKAIENLNVDLTFLESITSELKDVSIGDCFAELRQVCFFFTNGYIFVSFNGPSSSSLDSYISQIRPLWGFHQPGNQTSQVPQVTKP